MSVLDSRNVAKNNTSVSVLTVYEIYGLEIALAYLDYLATRATSSPEQYWIGMYLEACQYEMKAYDWTGSTISMTCMERVCNSIKCTLQSMESSQPRASEPLSKLDDQIVIPVEVLAKILQRNDISAAISKCLSIVGYIHYPTVVEMDKFNEETWLADHVTYAEGCLGRPSEYELVYLAGISEEEIGHVKYSLSKTSQNGEFILKNKLCNGDRTGRIIEYSLRTYDNFYNDREPTNKMLRDLQDRLTSCKLDEAEICSWIVQLSHTISNWRWTGNTEVRFSDLTSLRDELVRLIDVLLHQRASSLAA